MDTPTAYLDASGHALSLSAAPRAWVSARHAGEVLRSGDGDTQLSDSELEVTLVGGRGDDSYYLSAWGARVVERAGGGTDTITAWRNVDLPAEVENLILNYGEVGRGNGQANVIVVNVAGAQIEGAGGDDVLVGGKGATTYLFGPASGRDVIQGFSTAAYGADDGGRDYVRLTGYGFTRFDQVRAAMTQQGPDVVLQLSPTDSVTFRGKAVGDFGAANFHLELDTRGFVPTFAEEFETLRLVGPEAPTGTWKTSFHFGDQTGPRAKDSRTLSASDDSVMIYVDKAFPGLSQAPLGLDPFGVRDGVLSITATRIPDALRPTLWNYEFASGLITTETSFQQTYGYFEIRAKLPLADGAWPAFWLLPIDRSWPPEADVMEQIGDQAVYFSKHTRATGEHRAATWKLPMTDVTSFHTYGLLWTPTTLTWYVDRVAMATTSTPADMNKPMYLLANLAMGGRWPGAPDASLQSATMEIDYIRAWRLDPGREPAPAEATTAQSLTAMTLNPSLSPPADSPFSGL